MSKFAAERIIRIRRPQTQAHTRIRRRAFKDDAKEREPLPIFGRHDAGSFKAADAEYRQGERPGVE